jgi:hypothetical protein
MNATACRSAGERKLEVGEHLNMLRHLRPACGEGRAARVRRKFFDLKGAAFVAMALSSVVLLSLLRNKDGATRRVLSFLFVIAGEGVFLQFCCFGWFSLNGLGRYT